MCDHKRMTREMRGANGVITGWRCDCGARFLGVAGDEQAIDSQKKVGSLGERAKKGKLSPKAKAAN